MTCRWCSAATLLDRLELELDVCPGRTRVLRKVHRGLGAQSRRGGKLHVIRVLRMLPADHGSPVTTEHWIAYCLWVRELRGRAQLAIDGHDPAGFSGATQVVGDEIEVRRLAL